MSTYNHVAIGFIEYDGSVLGMQYKNNYSIEKLEEQLFDEYDTEMLLELIEGGDLGFQNGNCEAMEFKTSEEYVEYYKKNGATHFYLYDGEVWEVF